MSITQQIATHIREIHFGNNWTDVDMQTVLKDVTWQEAMDNSLPCNCIALLVFHTNAYLRVVHERMNGKGLTFKHKDSLIMPNITSEADWQALLQQTWKDAEAFATAVEQFPVGRLWEHFAPTYGNFYKNIQGIVEHNHYHLGQMVLVKKLLRSRNESVKP
jgi:hypothetical protein